MRLRIHIASEGLVGGTHKRIEDIVANPGERTKANQFPPAALWTVAADLS